MRNLLLGTYTFLLLLGLSMLFIFIPRFTPEYLGYGLPSSAMPNLLASCIVIFSFIELVKTYLNKEDKRPSTITKRNLLHLGQVAVVGFLTFPFMDFVGFIPGAICTIFAFQWICGQRDFKYLISISIILTLIIYFTATYLLLIPLP